MFQLAAGVIVFHIWLDCVSILIASANVFMVSFSSLYCSPHHQLISFIIRFIFRSSLVHGGVQALSKSKCTQECCHIFNHMMRTAGRSYI